MRAEIKMDLGSLETDPKTLVLSLDLLKNVEPEQIPDKVAECGHSSQIIYRDYESLTIAVSEEN